MEMLRSTNCCAPKVSPVTRNRLSQGTVASLRKILSTVSLNASKPLMPPLPRLNQPLACSLTEILTLTMTPSVMPFRCYPKRAAFHPRSCPISITLEVQTDSIWFITSTLRVFYEYFTSIYACFIIHLLYYVGI